MFGRTLQRELRTSEKRRLPETRRRSGDFSVEPCGELWFGEPVVDVLTVDAEMSGEAGNSLGRMRVKPGFEIGPLPLRRAEWALGSNPLRHRPVKFRRQSQDPVPLVSEREHPDLFTFTSLIGFPGRPIAGREPVPYRPQPRTHHLDVLLDLLVR